MICTVSSLSSKYVASNMHIYLGTMLVSHNKIAHCENPRMVWYKFKVVNYFVLISMKPYSSSLYCAP